VDRLSCANCDSRVGARDVVCRNCGAPLLEDGAVLRRPAPANPPAATEETKPPADATAGQVPDTAVPEPGNRVRDHARVRDAAGDDCPHCGAPVPDPQNLVCLECLEELRPPGSRNAAADSALATTRETPAALQLRFELGLVVDLAAGQERVLGREMAGSPTALAHLDNISRRHATVGLRPSGAAWVRDDGSTNGTFVDGARLPVREEVALPDGSELRLASNVRATVRISGASQ
jgi:hypothetical protein